jgi:hypothetical protein
VRALRLEGDGWRDIAWFDELLARVAATGKGELWFVAGNRRGVLAQVRARARDAPHCVAVGPDADDADGVDEVRDGLTVAAGAALGVVNPLAELALVLGDLGTRIYRAHHRTDRPDPSELFGFFHDLVGAAAGGGDTVVFIVDAQDRDEDLWNRRFTQLTSRAGRLQRQRLVLIVGLPDAPTEADDVDGPAGMACRLSMPR